MASGVKIDGLSLIGHEFNGIKIIDVYRMPCGQWGAQVECSCGHISKMKLRTARGLCVCGHKKGAKLSDLFV